MVRMARHHNPPPGRLVDVGGHRLHLRCVGSGAPAVIFDAALGGSSLSWSLLLDDVGAITRACAYDRAGFAWSDPGPMPRTAGRIADELYTLLCAGDVPPPYVLVGHSFGGLVVRLFAARHRALVAGLVLIEPAIPDHWINPGPEQRALLARGARLCRYGTTAARYGIARAVAFLARVGALSAARTLARVVGRGSLAGEDEGVLAPMWKLPRDVRLILAEMWGRPEFYAALGSQIEHISASAMEVAREAPAAFDDLPVTLITAERAEPWRVAADAALAASSSCGRQVFAAESGHWVPLDAPRTVVHAVSEMVARVRATT